MIVLPLARGPPRVGSSSQPIFLTERTQPLMSVKTTKFEKAAARMRKLEDEKRRAAEQARKQKLDHERLCGQALMDAAKDGDDFGEFLNKSVAELAVAVGLIDSADEAVAEDLARREQDRLVGEALRDAANGGDAYGDFLNKTVAELAAHLGIIDPVDEDENDGQYGNADDGQNGQDGDAGDGQDDDGATAPEADYDGAAVPEY